MSYKGIESALNIETKITTLNIGPTYIPWDCYTQNYKEKISNIVWFYWNNLSESQKIERLKNNGMKNKKHSDETKMKMRKSALGRSNPNTHKAGSIISEHGEIIHFNCLSEVCKKLNLKTSHLSEVLSGKRKTVKGWKKYGL